MRTRCQNHQHQNQFFLSTHRTDLLDSVAILNCLIGLQPADRFHIGITQVLLGLRQNALRVFSGNSAPHLFLKEYLYHK